MGEQHPVHRTSSSEWNERPFPLKAEKTREHNAGEIAEALGAAYEDLGAGPVVLIGDPRGRPAVHERLPDAAREVTVETGHGGRAPGSSSAALEEAVGRARRRYARRRVEAALDRFRAGRVGADRPADAVEAVPAPVEAAREHRIGPLPARSDGSEPGRETWVGARPDRVVAARTDTQPLGGSDPVPVRALPAAVDVLVVPTADEDTEGGSDLPTGGPGALPRWTYEPAPACDGGRPGRDGEVRDVERGGDPAGPRADGETEQELERRHLVVHDDLAAAHPPPPA